MKLAIVGVGNAGGKIADELVVFEKATGRTLCRSTLAINTAQTDLAKPEHIPDDSKVLVGQTDQRAKGHGVGGDSSIGADIMSEDIQEVERALDQVPIHDIDAFLVIAGLGGGTGSGGSPVLSNHLSSMYDEPVFGLAVLPGEDEGGRAANNAARSIQSFADATDNLLVFDNDAWRTSGDSVETGYTRTNRELAKRIVTLLAAGELDGSQVSENAMDSSDIIRTLDPGGVSSIAYAESEVAAGRGGGLIDRFRGDGQDGADPATKIHGLVRRAVRSRLTLPANVDSSERSLIVISGPPAEFSRKGLERARSWVEEQTESVEVLAGDDPRFESAKISATVLLSNLTDVPRIDAMQTQAVEAKRNIEKQASRREEAQETLLTDADDELDPII